MDQAIEKITKRVNGLNVVIKVYHEIESVEGDFDFGNEKENAEYLARFESGELLNVFVSVSVFDISGHVEGSDSLGMCHVRSNHLIEDIESILEDYDIIGSAINELKSNIEEVKSLN